ncbi:MAG: UpxY family transcription antiterminator [Alteromonadaceae bacterium]|nr:UpxY family transcription antiterminator [Alteromonadaceae bacterium]
MNSNDKLWYPIYTHANYEKKLLNQMLLEQMEAYLPLRKKVTQWSDRTKTSFEPLFKSYLFVKADLVMLNRIKLMFGFSQFIRFGKYPKSIPEENLTTIKLVEQHYDQIDIVATHLIKGDKVRVSSGALLGFDGVLTELTGKHKVAISIKQMGQSMLIHIDPKYLIKIN